MPVDVIIVNYRVYDDLRQAIRSVAGEVAPGDRVIVVDYEPDEAGLARAVGDLPEVVTIRVPENRGFAAGVNTAIAHGRAEFLLLMNPDSAAEGPLLRPLESWMQQHADVGVVGPRVLNLDGSVQASARRFPGPSTLLGGRSTWLTHRFPHNWFSRHNLVGLGAHGDLAVDWVSGACLMTRRTVFDRVGGFDERFFLYWEDADYCRRVTAAGYRCVHVPAVSVRHTGGASAAYELTNSIREFHRSAYQLFLKHSAAPARVAAPLVKAGLWARGEMRVRQATRARARRNGHGR